MFTTWSSVRSQLSTQSMLGKLFTTWSSVGSQLSKLFILRLLFTILVWSSAVSQQKRTLEPNTGSKHKNEAPDGNTRNITGRKDKKESQEGNTIQNPKKDTQDKITVRKYRRDWQVGE